MDNRVNHSAALDTFWTQPNVDSMDKRIHHGAVTDTFFWR